MALDGGGEVLFSSEKQGRCERQESQTVAFREVLHDLNLVDLKGPFLHGGMSDKVLVQLGNVWIGVWQILIFSVFFRFLI